MHIFGAHSCSCSFFMSASSRCSFICFPCTIVVIFEGMSVAARVMCRYFSEWTLSCLRKGTGGIFLWDWSASPLIAWLSLSRSGSRSLHSHVCGHRNSTRVSDLLFRPRNVHLALFLRSFVKEKSAQWLDVSTLLAVIFWSTWRNTN